MPKAAAKQAKPAGESTGSTGAKGLLKRAGSGIARAVSKVIGGAPAKPAGKANSVAKAAPKSAKSAVKAKSASKAKSAGSKAPAKEKTPAKPAKAPAKVAKSAAKAPVKAKAPAKATKAEPKVTKAAKAEPKAAKVAKVAKSAATKAEPKAAKAAKPAAATKAEPKAAKVAKATPKAPRDETEGKSARKNGLTGTAAVAAAAQKAAERTRLKAVPLPPVGTLLTRREMEQLLTAGQGRGVSGEGSLKGSLVMKDDYPTLVVIGRDKRELHFILQGPDQPLFPQYVDYRVSASGFIRKTSNYAGTIDVRKYTAKRADLEEPSAPEEPKLRYLSPGEVTQLLAASMGSGMKGFATVRGQLEMNGEDYLVVVSNAGTRHQVSFLLTGKNAKGLRKLLGRTVLVQGVVDKTTGWGGRVEVESIEQRAGEVRKIDRKGLNVHAHELGMTPLDVTLKLGDALSIRLDEHAGFTWAIEPMAAKRSALREVAFEPAPGGAGRREFFFTPRTTGTFEIDFFLAKVLTPMQVESTTRLNLTVRS